MTAPRLGYLWLPDLPVQAVWRRHPALRGQPVLLAPPAGRAAVYAACPACCAAGVTPGMPLRTALELVPAAAVLPPDPAGDAALLARALDLLGRWSAAIEQDGQAGAWFVPACGAHPAEERRLGAAVLDGLAAALGLEARLGIASGRFPAAVAARQAPAGEALVVAADQTAAFLAPLPLEVLPLPPQTVARLHRLGVHTIGACARLPEAGVRRRFGAPAATAQRLARGLDDTPLTPLRPPLYLAAERSFEPPLDDRQTVLRTALALGEELCRRLQEAGQACRSLRLIAVLEDGRPVAHGAELRAPAQEPRRLAVLLRRLVETLALSAPVSRLTVRLEALAPVQPVQSTLFLDDAAVRRARARAAWAEVARRYPHLPRRLVPGATPHGLLEEQRLLLVPEVPDRPEAPPAGEAGEAAQAEPAVRLAPVRLIRRGRRVWVRLPGPAGRLEELVARHACWSADEWWPQGVQRRYYRVRTRRGLVLTLACEPAAPRGPRWLLVEQVD